MKDFVCPVWVCVVCLCIIIEVCGIIIKKTNCSVIFVIYILLLIRLLITFHNMIEFFLCANGATPFDTQYSDSEEIVVVQDRGIRDGAAQILGAM